MKNAFRTLAASLVLLTVSHSLRADDETQRIVNIRVGDPAPAFQCRDDKGKLWRSKDHFGKKIVVVVYYMGDFFPDSDKRLGAFRDIHGHFVSLGAEVVG